MALFWLDSSLLITEPLNSKCAYKFSPASPSFVSTPDLEDSMHETILSWYSCIKCPWTSQNMSSRWRTWTGRSQLQSSWSQLFWYFINWEVPTLSRNNLSIILRSRVLCVTEMANLSEITLWSNKLSPSCNMEYDSTLSYKPSDKTKWPIQDWEKFDSQ